MIKKTKQIKIEVGLDENHIPEKITWSAEDEVISNKKCKAMFLSIWDEEKKEAQRIDLWIKQMPLGEMKYFFYQSFISMADTYKRASSDEALAKKIENFGNEFAKASEIFKD